MNILNFLKKIWNHKKGRRGIIIIFIVVILVTIGPMLSPHDVYDYNVSSGLLKPSINHWLGTDQNGIDILTQILYGGRISLIIGIATGILTTLFGAILGVVAGYFGKKASTIILGVVNVLMVIPTLPLMMILNDVSSSYVMMIFIFVAFGWTGIARMVRSEVLKLKNMEYIKQAELNGASKSYIMIKHILPTVSNLLIMSCALSCAGFMVAEAGLSFMGLGDPTKISWGKMLVAAQANAYTNSLWAWVLAPGIALIIVVTGFMQIGYSLEDILNPKMKLAEQNYNKTLLVTDEQLEEVYKCMDSENDDKIEHSKSDAKKIYDIKNLKILFHSNDQFLKAVEGIDLEIYENESIGIVGESGCGKSVTALSMMKLLKFGSFVNADKMEFMSSDGLVDINKLDNKDLNKIRGDEISMVFQDPNTSLNPVLTVGEQIAEMFIYHKSMDKEAAKLEAIELLKQVGIPDPEKRFDQFPHQFSGGQKQRILIAIAVSLKPKLIIADEPTTALDVTVAKQVLDLIKEKQKENNSSLLLITHDLGIVKNYTDRIYVMYCGKIVESGPTKEVLENPKHSYTKALLSTIPTMNKKVDKFVQIPNTVPSPMNKPTGCYFSNRCSFCNPDICTKSMPEITTEDGRTVRCHRFVKR
ncbi:MAG: dipeptide/oligopeptide/nickel ABC transporter permease/ATP-binding protein [bacterium]